MMYHIVEWAHVIAYPSEGIYEKRMRWFFLHWNLPISSYFPHNGGDYQMERKKALSKTFKVHPADAEYPNTLIYLLFSIFCLNPNLNWVKYAVSRVDLFPILW